MSARTVHRSRWFKRPWLLAFVATLLIATTALVLSDSLRFVVYSLVAVVLYGNSDESDRRQLELIIQTITGVHHFAHNSVSDPGRPPVSGTPGSKGVLIQPTRIQIYEVQDRSGQDQIIQAVQSLVGDHKLRPVNVSFIQHENWIVHGNVGERGAELQLRRVQVSQDRIREEGGEKTITYPVP